jgi:NAD(P)H-hydrate epimerase
MPPPILNREQSRAVDRFAIDQLGISSLVLMENAGRGCVDVLERLGINGPVAILCGKGNNAGDGFVIARHLAIRNHDCRAILLCNPDELTGDAATNFAILQKCDVSIFDASGVTAGYSRSGSASAVPNDALTQFLSQHAATATWLIDALLGTGARGEPRLPFDTAIDWINAQPAKKLAVDIPSGLDCDTGQPSAHTIRADHTCTFATIKLGFTRPAAAPYTGTVHICDIGLPPQIIGAMVSNRATGKRP